MGEIVTNPPSVPDTDINSWQPLVARDAMSYYGLNKISLINWDDVTMKPEIAQGSAIDIDGSIARFTTNEVIGGTPIDGIVYLKFVVAGSDVHGEFTAEIPTWYADKGGWYGVAGERFSGHFCTLADGLYTWKAKHDDSQTGSIRTVSAMGGVKTENASVRMKKITGTLNSSGIITVAHGIADWNNILSIVWAARNNQNGRYTTWIDFDTSQTPTHAMEIEYDATNVYIDLNHQYDSFYENQPYKIVILYEG